MQDIMGNTWSLADGAVSVHPAQLPEGEQVAVDAPAGMQCPTSRLLVHASHLTVILTLGVFPATRAAAVPQSSRSHLDARLLGVALRERSSRCSCARTCTAASATSRTASLRCV